MATIIDALIVTLGLDASGYRRGAQTAAAEQKKLKDGISALEDQIAAIRRKSTAATKTQDDAQIKGLRDVLNQKKKALQENRSGEQDQLKRQKDQVETLDKMKASALELFAVFTAGASLKSFVTDIITGDAAMGRMAANLGESAQTATAFGAVIASLGGKAEEGVAALSNLASIRFAEQARGDYSKAPVLSRLGVSPSDLNDLDSAMMKIAATAKTMPKALFYQYASEAGFSAGAINALELGNVELAKQIELAKAREKITDEQIAKDQGLITSLANLRDAIKGAGRELLGMIPEWVPALLDDIAKNHLPAVEGAIVGVAVAAGLLTLALAPELVVLTGITLAIAGVGAAFGELIGWLNKTKEGADLVHKSLDGLKNLLVLYFDIKTGNVLGGAAAAKALVDDIVHGAQDGTAIAQGKATPQTNTTTAKPSAGALLGNMFGAPTGSGVRADRNNNPGNLTDPRTGQFRKFQTREEGLHAMQTQILRDYNRGQNTITSLINDPRHGWSNQWAPGNSAASTAAYIASLSKALGVSANQRVDFSDPAILRRLIIAMSAVERGGQGIDPGLRPGALAALSQSSQTNHNVRSDVAINKVEVHVPVGSDGHKIGREIASSVRNQPFVAMANAGLA